MKKLVTLLLSCLLLACALPALAEDAPLHTFAGIPWDTPQSDFITVATEKAGVPFLVNPNREYSDDAYFIVTPGYYSIFGIQIINDVYRGLSAYYTQPGEQEAPETDLVFDSLTFSSIDYPLHRDAATGGLLMADLTPAQMAIDNVLEKFGTPTAAYYFEDRNFYTLPEMELSYIVEDAASYASDDFRVILGFNNVIFTLDAYLPDETPGSYSISIEYLNYPTTAQDFGQSITGWDYYMPDETTAPFPFVNSQIPCIVIEP